VATFISKEISFSVDREDTCKVGITELKFNSVFKIAFDGIFQFFFKKYLFSIFFILLSAHKMIKKILISSFFKKVKKFRKMYSKQCLNS